MKKAIALIVKEPDEIYLDFLQDFAQGFCFAKAGTAFVSYDIYIIVDSDNDLTELTKADKYKKLNFIQLKDEHCIDKGFQNVNFIGVNKMVSGWDKALLFFSVIMPLKYEYVWFIEDDVFFLREEVLTNLDLKYPNQDLIANCDFDKNNVNTNKSMNKKWLWPLIDVKIEKPWFAGMMCITRMSNTLLQCIRWYASKYNTLFFLEALFPTITNHFKLSYAQPKEFETITYRDVFFEDFVEEDQKKLDTHAFHPMKDLNKHKELREIQNKRNPK
jgi:hypothetical protein